MPGALQDLKILGFTTMLPGPYATMIMADLSAVPLFSSVKIRCKSHCYGFTEL